MIHTTEIGRMGLRLLACLAIAVASPLARADGDRLDTPAFRAPKASGAMLLDVVSAGDRLVAVGEHGIIVYSDTKGASWRQAEVPVSVTLTAVFFPTPRNGWAVGHDGVILRSDDGGGRWSKQFDGNRANALVIDAAQRRLREAGAVNGASAAAQEAQRALEDAQAGAKFGPSRPLFDVWFRNTSEGIVVGSFGQLFHTADGGRSWALWRERIANPDNLHYNAISVTGQGALLIAGEGGRVYRSIDGGASWATLDTGYPGQLYGVLGVAAAAGREVLIAFGFGGRVFRSVDDGAHWLPVALAEKKPLVSGLVAPDGGIALLTFDGRIWRSQDQGQRFTPAGGGAGMPAAAMTPAGKDAYLVAGASGTRRVSLQGGTGAGQP
ncbi:YCF48-related protein [Rugamonas sp. A1-17]|nr:YCF48-related protein [Rugamonas sp. A1-17]